MEQKFHFHVKVAFFCAETSSPTPSTAIVTCRGYLRGCATDESRRAIQGAPRPLSSTTSPSLTSTRKIFAAAKKRHVTRRLAFLLGNALPAASAKVSAAAVTPNF